MPTQERLEVSSSETIGRYPSGVVTLKMLSGIGKTLRPFTVDFTRNSQPILLIDHRNRRECVAANVIRLRLGVH